MKDRFSAHADNYVRYRPDYPDAFMNYLKTILPAHERAWDCGTGNGQLAQKLSSMFTEVQATDISEPQIANAVSLPNIQYSVQKAEQTNFPNNCFDLITVAQAIHWFDFGSFYSEVRRTAKQQALLAVVGYGRLRINKKIDRKIDDFYCQEIGPYWDKERRYVDEEYKTIPFPFTEITAPSFSNTFHWTFEHLVGYLETWSAVKSYKKENGIDPVVVLYPELKNIWGNEEIKEVNFPLLLRIGKVHR